MGTLPWSVRLTSRSVRVIMGLRVSEACIRVVYVRKLRIDEHERIIWTQDAEALLGTAPDPEIAETLGISVLAVRSARNTRGIAAFRRPTCSKRKGSRPRGRGSGARSWTEKDFALLGKLADRTIAERLGITAPAVGRKRKELGIPPKPRQSPRHEWKRAEIALLGTVPDTVLAERLGVTKLEAFHKRKELGIPLGRAPKKRRRWTAEEKALLGTMADSELAAKLEITTAEVARKRESLRIPKLRLDHHRSVDWRGALTRLQELDD